MGIENQHLPLVSRQAFVSSPSIGLLAPAPAVVGVGSGIPGIVQHAAGAAQGERDPGQFDDFVIMAKHIGRRIPTWVDATVEGWLGLNEPVLWLIERVNRKLQGWQQHFSFGRPRGAYRVLNTFVIARLTHQLQRRRQRPCRPPADMSWYAFITGPLGLKLL